MRQLFQPALKKGARCVQLRVTTNQDRCPLSPTCANCLPVRFQAPAGDDKSVESNPTSDLRPRAAAVATLARRRLTSGANNFGDLRSVTAKEMIDARVLRFVFQENMPVT